MCLLSRTVKVFLGKRLEELVLICATTKSYAVLVLQYFMWGLIHIFGCGDLVYFFQKMLFDKFS